MVSKPSLKQVHEKWRLEAFEIVKKKTTTTKKTKQRLAHLKICTEVQSLTGDLDDYIFFWINAQNTLLFSAA